MTMDSDKKICPYCGEEIMAAARKCKHCGEWLDKETTESPASISLKESKPKKNSSSIQYKKIMLNLAIALLVIANITVGYLWIKACKQPALIMESDVATVSSLIDTDKIPTRGDSISYAIGCLRASEVNKYTLNTDYEERLKEYAGMLRSLKSPNQGIVPGGISIGLQTVKFPAHFNANSKVGKFNPDAFFQGALDANTSPQALLMDPTEQGNVLMNSFKNN